MKIPFYILDVFTSEKYGGNQLGVFVDYEDVLTSEMMLKITRELNFSESTFIKGRKSESTYEARIFTPEYEVPFAGHPVVGTTYVIANKLADKTHKEYMLKLKQGDVSVSLSNPQDSANSIYTMTQTQPVFLKSFEHQYLADQLGLDISIFDQTQPIQEISTGLPYIIIPIKHLTDMQKLGVKSDVLKRFLLKEKLDKSNSDCGLTTSLFFFTTETYQNSDFNTRMFCYENGHIFEDAATGSANGCFLAYLLKFQSPVINARVEQGFEMHRKSYLQLDGRLERDTYTLQVGGGAVLVASGDWCV